MSEKTFLKMVFFSLLVGYLFSIPFDDIAQKTIVFFVGGALTSLIMAMRMILSLIYEVDDNINYKPEEMAKKDKENEIN